MYKFTLLISVLLALVVACATHTPAVSPPQVGVTHEDCKKLYVHMQLITVVDQIDPNLELSPKEFEAAMWEVDQRWQEEGMTAKLYNVLCPQMSKDQMECALNTQHVGDITTCIRLGKHNANSK